MCSNSSFEKASASEIITNIWRTLCRIIWTIIYVCGKLKNSLNIYHGGNGQVMVYPLHRKWCNHLEISTFCNMGKDWYKNAGYNILWFELFTANDDCSHEIKRCLLLGRKAMKT